MGVDIAHIDDVVRDARRAARHTLFANGFELRCSPLPFASVNFYDEDSILRHCYPDACRILKEATGASKVLAFYHNLRSNSKRGQRIKGGNLVQGPATVVHGDYTLFSAPRRLKDLAELPRANDTVRKVLKDGQTLLSESDVQRCLASGGRFAIFNVWRNISEHPVQTWPLALCDARTVKPEALVTFEIHYEDRVGENYFSKSTGNQEWWYYPEMTRDEVLLLKQWDSAGTLARSDGRRGDGETEGACTFSFHSAVAIDAPATAPDRESIEVRCICLWDNEVNDKNKL